MYILEFIFVVAGTIIMIVNVIIIGKVKKSFSGEPNSNTLVNTTATVNQTFVLNQAYTVFVLFLYVFSVASFFLLDIFWNSLLRAALLLFLPLLVSLGLFFPLKLVKLLGKNTDTP